MPLPLPIPPNDYPNYNSTLPFIIFDIVIRYLYRYPYRYRLPDNYSHYDHIAINYHRYRHSISTPLHLPLSPNEYPACDSILLFTVVDIAIRYLCHYPYRYRRTIMPILLCIIIDIVLRYPYPYPYRYRPTTLPP